MSAPVVPPPALSEDAIRRLLVDRVDERRLSVGMGVGVTEANSHRFVAYGCRDTCGGSPVNEKTLFEIGSITKLFTALLFSDMAVRGEVRLDEPVAELLPAGTRVPARDGRAITLRDLASHYSGLPRVATNGDSPDRPGGPYAAYSAERLYQFLAGHELIRTPGDSFEYSNVGAGLLGHALVLRAAASGYESLIRARILDPLRMDDTVIAIPSRLAANVASGHDDSLEPTSDWTFDVLAGTGAFRSTLSDLLRLMDAVCDPGSPIASIIRPLMTPRGRGGLELAKPHPGGAMALSKPGGTGGFRGFVRCIPEWKRGVVVLSNASIDAVCRSRDPCARPVLRPDVVPQGGRDRPHLSCPSGGTLSTEGLGVRCDIDRRQAPCSARRPASGVSHLGMAFFPQERARATHLRTRRGRPRRPPDPASQRNRLDCRKDRIVRGRCAGGNEHQDI